MKIRTIVVPGFANKFGVRTFCYICCSFSLITDSSSGPQNNQEVRNSGPKCALSVRQCQGGACSVHTGQRSHTHTAAGPWAGFCVFNLKHDHIEYITHHTSHHTTCPAAGPSLTPQERDEKEPRHCDCEVCEKRRGS